MVKIPSLSDLKKMGSELLDSAKSVKINEMVDRVKSGIENVGERIVKEDTLAPPCSEAVRTLFRELYASVESLDHSDPKQVELIKRLEVQLAALAIAVGAAQPVATETFTETNPEERKD